MVASNPEPGILAQFRKNLEKLAAPLSQPFAIALSGGSDSLALALLTKDAGLTLSTFTIDHQLRPESASEATQAGIWMQQYSIPHHILTWQDKPQGNLQAAARNARYHLLLQACRDHGIPTLLLGHTEDDQAETIAYRQQRNAGPVGLAGMTARKTMDGITLLRPLLTMPRAGLRDYLQAKNQAWINDPSNENTSFARILIRKALSAAPGKKAEWLALGQRMAKERKNLETEFNNWVHRSVSIHADSLTLPLPALHELTEEAGCDALSRLLTSISGRDYPPRYAELQRLWQKLQVSQGKATLGKCIIHWQNGIIRLLPENPTGTIPAKPLVPEPFCTIYDR